MSACPICGDTFECCMESQSNADGTFERSCWCSKIPIVQLSRIPAGAQGKCVCPKCLRSAAREIAPDALNH